MENQSLNLSLEKEKVRGYPFDVVFVDKKANHLRLQIAELLRGNFVFSSEKQKGPPNFFRRPFADREPPVHLL